MRFWPEYVLAQWSIEVVSEANKQHNWIIPGYDCVFRWEQIALRGNGGNNIDIC